MSAASRATSTADDDRDADVGGVQRRRVVDAVAHVADHVAAQLERENDAVLLHRRDAREDRRFFGQMLQARYRSVRSRSSPRMIVGLSSPTCSQTWRATSSLSPVRILTSTPSRCERRERCGGVGTRRIGEREVAGKNERRLIVLRVALAWLDFAVGRGEQAKTLAAQIVESLPAAM